MNDKSNEVVPLWHPSPERINSSHLKAFIDTVNQTYKLSIDEYDTLWDWSCHDSEKFWLTVWQSFDVLGSPGDTVLENSDNLLESKFFPNGEINYAENLLRYSGDEPAIIFHNEQGKRIIWSWEKLRAVVSQLQQAMRATGIVKGDCVAAYVPHCPETLACMLAATSLGAVWSSCSPDFGLQGVLDRFGQIKPKLLITADGYFYNGKSNDSLQVANALLDNIETVEQHVVFPFLGKDQLSEKLSPKSIPFADYIAPFEIQTLKYVRVKFNDPLFIMFSSGTTGLPKCIVHSVGGSLLQHLKEHRLQCDIKQGDRLFYFTTCGWMMWNWQVSALASGATLVIYDGSPFFPNAKRLPQLAQQESVTHFGTSAKYLDACAKVRVRPVQDNPLDSLRVILSTGSPLSADGFHYVYQYWKKDVCLSSIAGGTDILGCFVGGNPIGPVYAGECQKRHLGMDVRVFNAHGDSITGEPGELVCISPHPSMPIGFLNDPDNKRYKAAYFEKFENVWCHGDWVELTERGGMVFHGRSDATLNPGGVRIGTAEIYRRVERFDYILEAVAIGQQWKNDVRVILFVVLRKDCQLTDDVIAEIKADIRKNASPRHVPAHIIQVPEIPKTRSGKISELAVRDTVHGKCLNNIEALANPEALQYFAHIPALSS